MARWMHIESYIEVIGGIWMPYGQKCAMRRDLSACDIENMRDGEGKLTRESIDRWVSCNMGDFSSIQAWHANIAEGEKDLDFPWPTEDDEISFLDHVFPCEV